MQLTIKVTPKAKSNKIEQISTNHYHIHTTSIADKNKANQTVIKMLSKELKMAKSKLIIIKGAKDRNKIIKVQN